MLERQQEATSPPGSSLHPALTQRMRSHGRAHPDVFPLSTAEFEILCGWSSPLDDGLRLQNGVARAISLPQGKV